MHPLALLPSFSPPDSRRVYVGQIITPFDHGISNTDLSAIRVALSSEMNPNHLIGFASTLSADHPVCASLLYARATLLEQRPRICQDELLHDGSQAAASLSQLVDRVSNRQWSGANSARWISEVPLDARKNLTELVRTETTGSWQDVCEGLEQICRGSIQWPRLDRLTTAAEGASQASSLNVRDPSGPRHSPNVRDPSGPRHPSHSQALHYECALALTQPMHQRQGSWRSPTPLALQYPTAAALQAFGFHEMYPRTRGLDLVSRATDFANAALAAHRFGSLPWVCLLLQRRTELDALVYSRVISAEQAEREVRRAASDLVVDPRADLGDLPSEVILLARSLVIEIGPDLRVVDPIAARIGLRSIPLEPRSPDRQRWTNNYFKSAVLAAQGQASHA